MPCGVARNAVNRMETRCGQSVWRGDLDWRARYVPGAGRAKLRIKDPDTFSFPGGANFVFAGGSARSLSYSAASVMPSAGYASTKVKWSILPLAHAHCEIAARRTKKERS